MQMTVKFYKCETCGNIITKLKDSSVNVVCCGNPMKELIPGEVDAAVEKHVPAVTIEGDKLDIVVFYHRMWNRAYFYRYLIAFYGNCNLHGLWKKELV